MVALIAALGWYALTPVYYFIMGPEIASLPSHLRMTNGDAKLGCTSFARDWNHTFPTSGAYCEEVPRWRHWTNAVQNVVGQVITYRGQKVVSVK
jgi:hypothetical protein